MARLEVGQSILCSESEYFLKLLHYEAICAILSDIMLRLIPIIPRPLNSAGIKLALIDGMRDVGIEIRDNFEDTTKTWKHKVKFEPLPNVPVVGIDKITSETTSEDEIYGYVSSGTKAHTILPRRAKRLAFPGQFIPKTFPGIIGSGSGFSGPVDQFRDGVFHPGIDARKFDKEIKNKQSRNFKHILDNAMKIARKASGHAYP